MRIVTALTVLALVGLSTAAFADKYDANEKPWHPSFPGARAIVPEDEGVNNECPGQVIACGDEINPAEIPSPGGDVDWAQFYVSATGDLITISTDAIDATTMDTYLELYDACGGAMIAYDDDSGPGFYSLISNFAAPHAGWYFVKVRGYSTSSYGTYKLDVLCSGGTPPPVDDTCDGAGAWERCTSGSATGDLTPYHNNYDPGSGGCSSGFSEAGKDQVVKFDLQAGDVVNISYTQLNADAAIYIITDCANPVGSCVVGADDTVTGDAEVINWTATASGTYYLILDCYGTDMGGAYTLSYDLSCPGPEGACCVEYVCTVVSGVECERMGGQYFGDGTSCNPSPCPPPTPTKESSWGQIKSNYR